MLVTGAEFVEAMGGILREGYVDFFTLAGVSKRKVDYGRARNTLAKVCCKRKMSFLVCGAMAVECRSMVDEQIDSSSRLRTCDFDVWLRVLTVRF